MTITTKVRWLFLLLSHRYLQQQSFPRQCFRKNQQNPGRILQWSWRELYTQTALKLTEALPHAHCKSQLYQPRLHGEMSTHLEKKNERSRKRSTSGKETQLNLSRLCTGTEVFVGGSRQAAAALGEGPKEGKARFGDLLIVSCCIKKKYDRFNFTEVFLKEMTWVTHPDYLPEHLIAARKKMTPWPLSSCNDPRSQENHLQFLRMGEEGENHQRQKTTTKDRKKQPRPYF